MERSRSALATLLLLPACASALQASAPVGSARHALPPRLAAARAPLLGAGASLLAHHHRSSSSRRRRSHPAQMQLRETAKLSDVPSVDWSFIDAAYLITCPKPDGSNPRLDTAWKQLQAVGLDGKTEVCEFGTDDEDRIRGCYTSHISVLEAAEKRFADRDPSESLNVLVLEDNLSISPRVSQETLDAIASFMQQQRNTVAGVAPVVPDMVHLAYIMYVPGLSTERLADERHIVRLRCNADSVLGTTAYIISRSGLDSVLAEHRRTGYVDGGAIPNVMAKLFPDSRYAAFPMPLHRAATIKSLVNGQLDTLRALIFQPQVYTVWERALVGTGLSTNILFPALLVSVLLGAVAGASEAMSSIMAVMRGEEVSLVLPLLSSMVSVGCLLVLFYGLSLAPKPETQKMAEAEAEKAAAGS